MTVLVSRSFGKALENAERIIIDAKRSFKTKYASISFIERDHEVMIAKWGYDQATIPRDISIGAHAILSSEIMVLADAGKVPEKTRISLATPWLTLIGLACRRKPPRS